MKTIKEDKDGNIKIPEEYRLSEAKRTLIVTFPWEKKKSTFLNRDNRVSHQVWLRHKHMGNKPFIPEGYVMFDNEMFKIEEHGEQKDIEFKNIDTGAKRILLQAFGEDEKYLICKICGEKTTIEKCSIMPGENKKCEILCNSIICMSQWLEDNGY